MGIFLRLGLEAVAGHELMVLRVEEGVLERAGGPGGYAASQLCLRSNRESKKQQRNKKKKI
jgi:hypothetical protein